MTEPTKQCPTCGEVKPLSAFHRNQSNPDGRNRWCAECVNAWNRESSARRRAVPLTFAPPSKWVSLTCKQCGKIVHYLRSDLMFRERRGLPLPKFCSRQCAGQARKHSTKVGI